MKSSEFWTQEHNLLERLERSSVRSEEDAGEETSSEVLRANDEVTLCVSVSSEAEQTAAPETTPEGEENAPAGSENK